MNFAQKKTLKVQEIFAKFFTMCVQAGSLWPGGDNRPRLTTSLRPH